MSKGRIDKEYLQNTIEGTLAEQEKVQEYCDRVFGYIFGDVKIGTNNVKKSFEKVFEMVKDGTIPIPKNDSEMASDIGIINAILRFSRSKKGGFLTLNTKNLEANQGLHIAGNIISTQGNDKLRTIFDIVNSLNQWSYGQMDKYNSPDLDKNGLPSPSSSPKNIDPRKFFRSGTITRLLEHKKNDNPHKSRSGPFI